MSAIVRIRKEVLAVSQIEMARLAGVTQATVSRWESGEIPVSAETAVAIERATEGKVARWELRPDLWDAPAQPEAAA